jgi:hypothetical protein
VVVEKKGGCLSGCGTTLAVMLLIGLAVEYWYISLALVAIVVVAAAIRASNEREKARHRVGPRDPWLNAVAVALADLGLVEFARNTGKQLGGAPIEGDIGLQDDKFQVYVTLFADGASARQAELGLRAKPNVRDAASRGASAIRTDGRVVYVANGRGGALDEFRLDDVVRVVGALPVPAPLATLAFRPPIPQAAGAAAAPVSGGSVSTSRGEDVLAQLRTLAQLRAEGVITEHEFEAKKADLLDRI